LYKKGVLLIYLLLERSLPGFKLDKYHPDTQFQNQQWEAIFKPGLPPFFIKNQSKK